MSSLRSHLVAAVGAVALLSAPLVALPTLELPNGFSALAGSGKGNGGGGGNEKSQGKSENSSQSNGSGTSSGQAKKAEKLATLTTTEKTAKTKNIKAELAGLNSLKRNVNGLMNSADPRMEAIRTYVLNGAELELAQQQLVAANQTLEGAEGTFASLAGAAGLSSYDGLYAYDDLTLTILTTRLQTLESVELLPTDPNYEALQSEIGALQALLTSGEASAVVAAQEAVVIAGNAVTTETLGTTDADLTAALLLAANENRVAAAGEGYVTPEILDWAKMQLGTGEYDGAIDSYLAGL
jgi:hypothetical protein